jgi:predicted transcriptional regulator
MPRHPADALTRREREIVNAVFALGNLAAADEIRARLSDPPSPSAVRVMLARLEKKGRLKHRQDGARHLYSATTSPTVARRTALQHCVRTIFAGSLKDAVTSLVNETSWTDDDLVALREEIDRIRDDRKKP